MNESGKSEPQVSPAKVDTQGSWSFLKKVLPRRKFAKQATLGAAALATGAWLGKEIQAGQDGFETSFATFIPLYERHDQGVPAKDIPDDLDYFMRESPVPQWAFELEGYHFLALHDRLMNSTIETVSLQPSAAEKFARNGTKVLYSDVPPGITYEEGKGPVIGVGITGVLIAMAGFLNEGIQKIQDEAKGNRPSEKDIKRRTFLKRAGIITAALATSPVSGQLSGNALSDKLDRKNFLVRVHERIFGLASNIHPEETFLFFRNIIIAEKLLTLSEELNKANPSHNKFKIGINMGGDHAGIEDLLRLDPETLRNLISFYPKEFLTSAAQKSGSLENFCSSIMIEIPPDFRNSDLTDNERQKRISKKVILDNKLFQTLSNRLNQSDKSEVRK